MDAVGAAVIIRKAAVDLCLDVVKLQLCGALWRRELHTTVLTDVQVILHLHRCRFDFVVLLCYFFTLWHKSQICLFLHLKRFEN